ncbi:MAG: L,D-transpeptidase family protein [Terrimicrobiaceae bacterium]
MRYLTDAYATLYLGADGSVVTRQTQAAKPQEGGFWRGSEVSGAPSIVIDLGAQKAFFYKAGKLVGMSPISSGREGYRTPTGRFSIIQKDRDHLSTLYGDYVDSSGNVVVRNVGVMEDPKPPGTSFRGAPMPYFMRIHGGVGMHAGYLPGVPDSHGCIRLPLRMAQVFFSNAPHGTPVSVTY